MQVHVFDAGGTAGLHGCKQEMPDMLQQDCRRASDTEPVD